ncbi:hypothetical protein MGYG_05527 [Nannizzia gypsea CBS 118893]|uniref:Mediator of RNA polymerase II transcription subunit 12 n=1 Tax=Arthroderma gypseum (strain ATCC MYA-4604 / CBS 118893) TaxID=535722 RepID=E4UWD6_ARTGP|nr:hypothetical protein MGYG_05527 [Nannizzia gypsea CBS 118893]EFR02531.1 hypothetical protein MGYG_05527 [Nannizzia gypsea CBS 118893]
MITSHPPQMSNPYSQPSTGFSDLPAARMAFQQQARLGPGNDLGRGLGPGRTGRLGGPGTNASPVIDLTGSNDEDDEDLESSRPAKRLRIDTQGHDEIARILHSGARLVHVLSDDTDDGQYEAVDENEPFVESVKPPASFQDRLAYMSMDGGGQQSQSSPAPLPMPPRPRRSIFMRDRPENAVEDAEPDDMVVKTTPYTMEKPAAAARLADNTILDFHPWTGNNPEDSLNEHTAKQGFYDRIQLSQNESNTARPSLYSHFKNPNGLKNLSHIFAQALKRRQAMTKVTPNSTFKPPPRVTLTDNKREAWLRDLANPSVPLRRLSRTIPHGIRGKILLDQCLGKNIPIGRAIWLAKCVGANEIRAFKRKGTAAAIASGLETKWVKDWTGSVQQFIEGVLQSHEEAGWIENQAYAMRLSGRLFLEQLLDQDAYLEWFLSSLHASNLKTLPTWLTTISVYWKNLTIYRKRSRRLAQTLLDKLALALDINRSTDLSSLINQLQSIIRSFITSYPSSFLLPLTWSRHQKPLTACFNTSVPLETAILAQLIVRNTRLSKTSPQSVTNSPELTSRPAAQQLISLLDGPCAPNAFPLLAAKCLALPLDHPTLVHTLLEWSSTPFRYGCARIYVGVRLLRRWRKLSIDTDAHILYFLAANSKHSARQLDNVYHLVAELVRSQSFSVGKYLEWLVARGAVRSPDKPGQYLTADVELLRHLPPSRLPEHIWNLRNTLLSRAGVSVDDEARQVRHIKTGLLQMHSDIFTGHVDASDTEMADADVDCTCLTWTVKSEVSHWIREQVALKLLAQVQVKNQPSGGGTTQTTAAMLRPDQFYSLRSILERLGDISILADVLKLLSPSADPTILASLTDTLNYHLPAFTAIGATMDLFQSLAISYTKLSKTEPHVQYFIGSMLDMALAIPSEATTVAVLRRDLIRYDKKSAMAASSPVSEHMADTLNPVNPTFGGMLDQLLASGNCMDDATLLRIFELLIQKLETGKADISITSSEAARYLAQLRLFNPKTFDGLMIKRVVGMIRTSPRPRLSEFLPPLVGVGCVTLLAFFGMVKGLLEADKMGENNIPDVMQLRLDMLGVLGLENAGPSKLPDFVLYRFKIARRDFVLKHCGLIIGTIRDAIIDATDSHDVSLQEQWDTAIFPLLCEIMVRHPNIGKAESAKWMTDKFPTGLRLLTQTLDSLLNLESGNGNFDILQLLKGDYGRDANLRADPNHTSSNSQPIQKQALDIVCRIDDFSLPFCLTKLQLLLEGTDMAGKENILDPVFAAAEADVKKGVIPMGGTKKGPGLIIRKIKQKAEIKLLSLFITSASSSSTGNSADSDDGPAPHELALIYLRIIEELICKSPNESISPSIGSALLERMNLLLQRVAFLSKIKPTETNSIIIAQRNEGGMLGVWVYILLRLVALYRSSFNVERASKLDLTDQTRLLLSICYMAFTPALVQVLSRTTNLPTVPTSKYSHLQKTVPANWSSLRTYAIDVATILVDTLPDEARIQCARFLRDRSPLFHQQQQDTRLLYLFGPMPDPQAAPTNPSTGNPMPGPPVPGSSPLSVQSHAAQGSSVQTPHQANQPIPTVEETTSPVQNFRFQQGNRILGPCPPRSWEMIEESAPVVGVNDTAINLSYFGARAIRAGLK